MQRISQQIIHSIRTHLTDNQTSPEQGIAGFGAVLQQTGDVFSASKP